MDIKTILSNVRNWVHGLIAAAIGGAFGAVGQAIADPSVLDFTSAGLKKIGIAAGVAAALAAAGYLSKSPIPWGCPTVETKKPGEIKP